jgi:uncharacterized protein (DUF849 family)
MPVTRPFGPNELGRKQRNIVHAAAEVEHIHPRPLLTSPGAT